MLERPEVEQLLRVHQHAYQVLLLISERAARTPATLDQKTIAQLRDGDTCRSWLLTHRKTLPKSVWPGDDSLIVFAQILASIFRDSFSVDTLEWDGVMLNATVRVDTSESRASAKKRSKFYAEAVKRLARSVGRRLAWTEAHQVAKSADIADDITLWAWVFELSRRAKGRESGAMGRSLWRAIPQGIREDLQASRVIMAQDQILARVRELD